MLRFGINEVNLNMEVDKTIQGSNAMIQINLLPWREQMRQVKKTQFITSLVSSVLISLIILAIFHFHYSSIASEQNDINAMLSAAISEEQSALNEMSSREDEKKSVDVQLEFIINLYNESYSAVRFLNELVTLVPNTILLQKIKRNGNQITLTGLAVAESDITQLLDEVSKSPDFNQPTLSSINLEKNTGDSRGFKLMFEQKGS